MTSELQRNMLQICEGHHECRDLSVMSVLLSGAWESMQRLWWTPSQGPDTTYRKALHICVCHKCPTDQRQSTDHAPGRTLASRQEPGASRDVTGPWESDVYVGLEFSVLRGSE